MVTPRVFRLSVLMPVLLLVLGTVSVPARGEEEAPERLSAAFVGPLSAHLADLLSDDPAKIEAARVALLAEGRRARGYVRITWECTEQPEPKARLAKLLAEFPKSTEDWHRVVARPNPLLPGGEEWCPFDLPAYLVLAAGRDRVAARVAAARKPLSLVAAGLHFTEGRKREGLAVLRDVIRARPELAVDAVDLLDLDFRHDHERSTEVGEVKAAAYAAAQNAQGEARARILFAWYGWHPDGWQAGLKKVLADAPGTPSALLAAQRLIDPEGGDSWAKVAALEAFAAEHPGTEAAAKALDEAAFHLSNTNTAKRGEDPIGRLEHIAALARRRASMGPGSPIDGYLEGFWVSHAKYAEKSIAAFREAYRTFYANHLLFDEPNVHEWAAANLGYGMLGRFGGLAVAEAGGEDKIRDLGPADVDAALKELDRIEAQSRWKNHVRYFRGALLAKHGRVEEAVALLRDLSKSEGLHGRKALATLATALYAQGEWSEAAKQYEAYSKAYPNSEYAFFAALRTGHAHARAKRWKEAGKAYRAAALTFSDHPVAGPLAHALLGRAHEEGERYLDAADHYEKALALWNDAYGPKLHTALTALEGQAAVGFDPDAGFTREWLVERAGALRRTQEDAEARVLFERGRKLSRKGEAEDAIALWTILLERGMGAELEAEVRQALGDVLLTSALDEIKKGRVVEARQHLGRLTTWGSSFSHFAAGLTDACALLTFEGKEKEAIQVLDAAVARFAENQDPQAPETDLEKHVAGVRAEAFQPPREGQADYRERTPYVVLPPDVPVVLADGTTHVVDFRQEMELASTEIYFTASEVREIGRIIDAIGGAERTEPGSVMAVAQPKERARRVGELISRFFPVRPGHWGGWHVYSYPTLLKLEFLDDAMTRAKAEFRIGFRGGERLLRLESEGWKTEKVQMTWIE